MARKIVLDANIVEASLRVLSDPQAGALLRSVSEYTNKGSTEIEDTSVRIAFESLKVGLDHQRDVGAKRRESASVRWNKNQINDTQANGYNTKYLRQRAAQEQLGHDLAQQCFEQMQHESSGASEDQFVPPSL